MEGFVDNSSRVDDKGENAKKQKLNDCAEEDYFKDFTVIKILNQSAQHKSIFVHGRFGNNDQDAVLILEKPPFNEKSVIDMLKTKIKVTQGMHNDIYRTQELFPSPEFAGKLGFQLPSDLLLNISSTSGIPVILRQTFSEYRLKNCRINL